MNVGRASKSAGIALVMLSLAGATAGAQQWTPQKRGSDNMEVVAHLPLGPRLSVADIDIEQELARPYAYVGVATHSVPRESSMISLILLFTRLLGSW